MTPEQLAQLSPAPWEVQTLFSPTEFWVVNADSGKPVAVCPLREEAAFFALARNDLEVQLRRGWHVEKYGDNWFVPQMQGLMMAKLRGNDIAEASWQKGNPVGLLTKADKFYRENVEQRT